jgi:hypothetical protein
MISTLIGREITDWRGVREPALGHVSAVWFSISVALAVQHNRHEKGRTPGGDSTVSRTTPSAWPVNCAPAGETRRWMPSHPLHGHMNFGCVKPNWRHE